MQLPQLHFICKLYRNRRGGGEKEIVKRGRGSGHEIKLRNAASEGALGRVIGCAVTRTKRSETAKV
jgi:hypothetical protein